MKKKIRDLKHPIELYNVRFHSVWRATYADGNLAVMLQGTDTDGFNEWQSISVNIPKDAAKLRDGEFFLKNWSELEELAKQLIANGEIVLSGRSVQTGFVDAPIVTVSP